MKIESLKAFRQLAFTVLLPAGVLATSSYHFLAKWVGQPILERVPLVDVYIFFFYNQKWTNNNQTVHLCLYTCVTCVFIRMRVNVFAWIDLVGYLPFYSNMRLYYTWQIVLLYFYPVLFLHCLRRTFIIYMYTCIQNTKHACIICTHVYIPGDPNDPCFNLDMTLPWRVDAQK